MAQMKRKNVKKLIAQMEKEMQQKLQLVRDLHEENTVLHMKHQLLVAFCDGLDYLRKHSALDDDLASASELLLLEQLSSIFLGTESTSLCSAGTEEAATRVALGNRPRSAPAANGTDHSSTAPTPSRSDSYGPSLSSTTSSNVLMAVRSLGQSKTVTIDSTATGEAAADAVDDGMQPVAPPGDPLYLFRLCLLEPTEPQSKPQSPEDLRQELLNAAAQMVKDMAYQLQLFETGNYNLLYSHDDPNRPRPLQKIRESFLHYHRLLSWTVGAKQGNLVADMTVISHDGSELRLQEHSQALYSRAVRQIGLSMDQMQQISQGIAAFIDIRSPVYPEMRQLQHEVAAHDTTANSTHKSHSQSDLGSAHSSLFHHLGRKNQQEQQLSRLRVLLCKDMLISAAMKSYAFDIMTWPQIAKCFAVFSPCTPSVMPFANAVSEYLQELREQQ